MARKSVLVTINEEGRDQGKTFKITELPAAKAEDWGIRALLAVARSGIQVPDNVANMGLAGVAAIGFNALSGGINFFDLKPLLDEMMTSIKYVPDPHNKPDVEVPLLEDTIEEVMSRIKLRQEWFKLHTDFLGKLIQLDRNQNQGTLDTSNTQIAANS